MRTIRLYLHPLIQPVAIYFVCPPINLILQASKSKIYLYEQMQDYLKPYDRTFAVKLHLDAINQAIRSCFHPPSNTSRIFLLHPSLRIVLHPKSCPGGFYWFRSTSLLRDKHESMLPLGNLIGWRGSKCVLWLLLYSSQPAFSRLDPSLLRKAYPG